MFIKKTHVKSQIKCKYTAYYTVYAIFKVSGYKKVSAMAENKPPPPPPSDGDQDFMPLQSMLDQNNEDDNDKKESQSNSDPIGNISKMTDMADTLTDATSGLNSSATNSLGDASDGGSSNAVSGVVEAVEANPELVLLA